MKIRNRLNPSNPCFSFEFFPPKTEEGVQNLLRTLETLAPLDPGFVSVTYGAGGSTRDRTLDLVTQIKDLTGIEAMAHLSCVGHTKDELAEILDRLAATKLENVLALRGDPPQGERRFVATPGGFRYASRAGRLHPRARLPVLRRRGLLPRGARRERLARRRSDEPQEEGRRRLRLRDHPALLRQRLLLRLRRAGAAGRDQRADRAGDHADHELRAAQPVGAAVRRDDPDAAACSSSSG